MKIASITVFCNEIFRLNAWVEYYNLYKDDLYMHIIVNNGNPLDCNILKSHFPSSIIINSDNKSLTLSNNLAINRILLDQEVDAVLLISNDIKINKGEIIKLYQFLYSNTKYGMVSPILLKKDSNIVENFGASIDKKKMCYIPLDSNKNIEEIKIDSQICDTVPGGINLAKREFYEKVGLQDEFIYMYADEVDMGIRGEKKGYIFASTKNAKAWHQHVFIDDVKIRSNLAAFLWSRNEIYLAKKHFNTKVILNSIIFRLKYALICNISVWVKKKDKHLKKFYFAYFIGVIAGISNIRKIPKRYL